MNKRLSTFLPKPPELQPIRSTSEKLWNVLSLFLTITGLGLMGTGGWMYVQQQIEAAQPPPARVLDVSSAMIVSTATPAREPSAIQAEASTSERPAVAARNRLGDTIVVARTANPEVATPQEMLGLAVEKTQSVEVFETEESAAAPPAVPEPTATSEGVVSLADNPLLVVEEEQTESEGQNSAPLDAPIDEAGESGAIFPAEAPLTRFVAESIGLDSEVVEVGWQEVMRNGVTANAWVVADYAVGWHKNSSLPGQNGNIVLSAHHNIKGEVFRYIVDLEPGDIVTLYDQQRSYSYEVVDKFIIKDKGEPESVRRENAKWIGPFNEERLTMVTCWPYNSNTHRVIVISKPVDTSQALSP